MRYFLLYVTLFVAFTSRAQKHKLPLDTNYAWNESWFLAYTYPVNASYNSTYQINIIKDTIINSKIYQKLKNTTTSYYSSNGGYYYPNSALQLKYIRQDTILKRVVVLDNSLNEKILYNFNKSIGDTAQTFSYGGVTTYTIMSIDSILLNDAKYHKRYNGLFIEGVGSIHGLLTPYVGFDGGNYLNCMAKINPTLQTIYHQSGNGNSCPIATSVKNYQRFNSIYVYPNPTNDYLYLNTENAKPNTVDIYNSFGQLLKTIVVEDYLEKLNVIEFTAGFYILKINFQNYFVQQRFIKS